MSFHLGQRSRDSVYLRFNVTQSDNNTCRCEATIIRCCFFHPFIHIRGFVIQLFTITIFETLFEARNDRGYHLGSQLLESVRDSFKTLLRGLFSIHYDRCLVSRWRTSISFSDSVEMEKHRNVCGSARDKIRSKSSLYRYGAIFRPPGVHDFSGECLSGMCTYDSLIVVPSFYLFIFLHALEIYIFFWNVSVSG